MEPMVVMSFSTTSTPEYCWVGTNKPAVAVGATTATVAAACDYAEFVAAWTVGRYW